MLCNYISLMNSTFIIKVEEGPVKSLLNLPVRIAWGNISLLLLLQVYGLCL